MNDVSKYVDDIAQYVDHVNVDVVEALVKSLASVLGDRDAANVACSDDSELATVRTNFIEGKLGVDDADKATEAMASVCEMMKGDNSKNRVVYYYLVAKELGCLGKLG